MLSEKSCEESQYKHLNAPKICMHFTLVNDALLANNLVRRNELFFFKELQRQSNKLRKLQMFHN